MLKYIFKSATGSFSRTIGRILAYIAIGALILLFGSFINMGNVKAETIPVGDEFRVTLNNSSSFPMTFSVNNGSERSYYLYFYNYVGISKPYSYLTASVCSNGSTGDFYITNPAYNSYFDEDFSRLDTKNACTVNGVSGTIMYLQFRVGKYGDLDDTGEELVASSYLRFVNWSGHTSYYKFINWYVSSDDLISKLSSDQKLLDQMVSVENGLSAIDSAINNVNSAINNTNNKLDDLNSKQHATNNKLDDLNNSMKDDNVSGAQGSANSFFKDFEDKDYGLSGVITMPLTFINKITSGTCTPLSFPAPFVDQDITLPCMYDIYQTYFGDFLTIYQTITFGVVSYWVCVNIFRMVKNFKNPDNDEIEVLDL